MSKDIFESKTRAHSLGLLFDLACQRTEQCKTFQKKKRKEKTIQQVSKDKKTEKIDNLTI